MGEVGGRHTPGPVVVRIDRFFSGATGHGPVSSAVVSHIAGCSSAVAAAPKRGARLYSNQSAHCARSRARKSWNELVGATAGLAEGVLHLD